MMRYPAKETAARHERILQEASRLFRERGIGGVSLPEIMKAAQLTHGPFYNHFESKEALIAESLKCAMDSKLEAWRTRAGKSGLREFLDEYLSREHCDNPGDACVAPVLAGEIKTRCLRCPSSWRRKATGKTRRVRKLSDCWWAWLVPSSWLAPSTTKLCQTKSWRAPMQT
jgi:AcrR family transcriptional regulator